LGTIGLAGIVLRLTLGVGLGFFIGLTGVGGGVLVIPSLMYLLHLPTSTAVGTANLYAFLTKVAGTYHHWREKNLALDVAKPFLCAAVPANIVVAYIVSRTAGRLSETPEAWEAFQNHLRLVLVGVVLLSAVLLVIRQCMPRGEGRETLADRLQGRPKTRALTGMGLGVVVGALVGATSVGGGVLVVPALMLIFGLTARQTVGTSILLAVVLTLVSSLVYSASGETNLSCAVLMSAGSLIGVPLGVRLSVRVSSTVLERIVVVVVVIAGIMLLAKGH